MPRARFLSAFAWLPPVAASLLIASPALAQTEWIGLTKSFIKLDGTVDMLPENQDALTTNVVLTRGSSGGLINISDNADSFYDLAVSPMFTEWATDLNNSSEMMIDATNWQNLSFTNWISAFGGPHSGGAFIADRNAVVHLVPDNIYLDLKFTSWTSSAGGGFSYLRAEPPVALPTTGDYNGDQFVDAADYVVWRDTLGNIVSLGRGADGDKSGKIDAGDYDFWRERFGNPVPAAAAGLGSVAGLNVAIPEPASGCLLFFGLFGFQWWLGRRLRLPQHLSRDFQ